MKNKNNFDIEKLIKDVKKDLKPSKFDPNGSWTGLTKEKNKPLQDQDDL